MIYTSLCVMFLMQADTLHGQVGGGWALEICPHQKHYARGCINHRCTTSYFKLVFIFRYHRIKMCKIKQQFLDSGLGHESIKNIGKN
jgi:hypothetical protein